MSTVATVPEFPEHLQSALQALRAAIIELLSSVGADPAKPQDLARRFGLNKNLTWKISKIASSQELYAAVPHIPGSAGLKIFLDAIGQAGAPSHLVTHARQAASDFERVVKVHTGDRTTLEIMISGMLPASAQIEQNEQSRKLAYKGNSGIWGVRAQAQIAMNIMAPNADDPSMADLVQVHGVSGFHRLHQDARWLLFRREQWTDDSPRASRSHEESLDPDYPVGRGVPFIGEFCSKPIPDLEVNSVNGEDQYELPPGPVGHTAAFTCIAGGYTKKIGAVCAERDDEYSEIGCNLITPVRHLLMDLLIHRDFEWAMDPELLHYSRMDGGMMPAVARRERNVLSVTEPVRDLGWGAVALANPVIPKYTKLVKFVFDRVDWNPDDFRAYRFTMAYPPIPSAVLFRAKLPMC